MERREMAFIPQWEGVISGWTFRYIRKNHWRVSSTHDFEDLVQEAQIKFLICKRRYAKVTKPNHFMSLYQCAITNLFNSLSKAEMSRFNGEYDFESHNLDYNTGPALVAMGELPQEAQKALIEIAKGTAGNNVARESRKFKRKTTKKSLYNGAIRQRETTNEFFCRAIGSDPNKVNISRELRNFSYGRKSDKTGT